VEYTPTGLTVSRGVASSPQLPSFFFNNFILLTYISYGLSFILSFLKQILFYMKVFLTDVTILPTLQQKDFRWLL
jgi:hypothetical protein